MLIRAGVFVSSGSLRGRLVAALSSPDVHISTRSPDPPGWAGLAREGFHLVVTTDVDLPATPGDLFATLRAGPERTEFVVVVDDDDAGVRAAWLETGAMAVVSRFVGDTTLRKAVGAIARRRRQTAEAETGEKLVSRLGDFVSQSLAMNELLDLARRVAVTDTSLLVLGETGVGKEWLARAIHEESPRHAGPFVAVSCAAIPEGLLESELFGHVEGAFTGALRSRRGHFERAHGGTLFLDEIGELPPGLQAKLLRAVQDRSIQPLGAEEIIPVDVRIMAATNRDLEEMVTTGEFRTDLYYRLGVIGLRVPPLRERREDIPDLAETYRARFAIQFGRAVESIGARAMEALIEYPWPGNVRELINVLERGVLLSSGEALEIRDLPRSISAGAPGDTPSLPVDETGRWTDRPLADARADVIERFEREYLDELLERHAGRVGEAAQAAGIDPRTLYNKMRGYGMRKETYRGGEGRTPEPARRER